MRVSEPTNSLLLFFFWSVLVKVHIAKRESLCCLMY